MDEGFLRFWARVAFLSVLLGWVIYVASTGPYY